MAVTDLHKTQIAVGLFFTQLAEPAEAVGLEHAALHHAKRPRAGPGHALQKPATVNAVMVMVMQNHVILFVRHVFLRGPARFFAQAANSLLLVTVVRGFYSQAG